MAEQPESRNSLSLVGDGDDDELLDDLRRTFGASCAFDRQPSYGSILGIAGRAPSAAPLDMGRIFDWATHDLAAEGLREGRCLSQHVFYRLRRALSAYASDPVTPRTPLVTLSGRGDVSALWRDVEMLSDLRLPETRLGDFASAGCLALSLGSLPPAFLLQTLGLLPGLQAVGLVAGCWGLAVLIGLMAPQRAPRECRTVGDLSHAVTALNYGRLARELKTYRESDAWDAFTRTIRLCGEGDIDIQMNRSTRLYG